MSRKLTVLSRLHRLKFDRAEIYAISGCMGARGNTNSVLE